MHASTNKIPICPNCSYALDGHTPASDAEKGRITMITCPECGCRSTYTQALSTYTTKNSEYVKPFLALLLLTVMMAIMAVVLYS